MLNTRQRFGGRWPRAILTDGLSASTATLRASSRCATEASSQQWPVRDSKTQLENILSCGANASREGTRGARRGELGRRRARRRTRNGNKARTFSSCACAVTCRPSARGKTSKIVGVKCRMTTFAPLVSDRRSAESHEVEHDRGVGPSDRPLALPPLPSTPRARRQQTHSAIPSRARR